MILLLALLAAFLVGTLYHAAAGFWKKPRLALVTFVFTFVPAIVVLFVSGWKPPLIGDLNGWAYLALVYLGFHLSGLLAWCWVLVEERLARLYHKLKIGLAVFLIIGGVWLIFRGDGIFAGGGEVLEVIIDLLPIAIIVFGALWLFWILRGKPADKEEDKAEKGRAQASQQAQETRPPEDQPPQDRTTQDQPKSEPPQSPAKDSIPLFAQLKTLLKNLRARLHIKAHTKDGRPRLSIRVVIENLRSRIPWTLSIEDIGPLLHRLFPVKKLLAKLLALLRRAIRVIRARFTKSETPPPKQPPP